MVEQAQQSENPLWDGLYHLEDLLQFDSTPDSTLSFQAESTCPYLPPIPFSPLGFTFASTDVLEPNEREAHPQDLISVPSDYVDVLTLMTEGSSPSFSTTQVDPATALSAEEYQLLSSPSSVSSFGSSPAPSVDSAGLSSFCLDEHRSPSACQVPAAGRNSSEPMDDNHLVEDVGPPSPNLSDDSGSESAQQKKSNRPTRRRSESRFNDARQWVKGRIKARDINGSMLRNGAKFSCPYCKHVSRSKHSNKMDHLYSHAPVVLQPAKLICWCGKKYAQSRSLRRHQRLAHGEHQG
ncbi:hypothetical protein CF326_g1122 [Tilletia indica]|nr:hypothetical protein CF326_g1122 [Tilletia indica]